MRIYKEKRPWGWFQQYALNEKCTVKIITVLPKRRFSLQYHNHRTELWEFLDNPAKITKGNKTKKVKRGDRIIIKPKVLHRVEAFSKPVRFLEVSFGKFLEKDIKRIEDDYGRT